MNKSIIIIDYNNIFCQNYNLTTTQKEAIMTSVISKIVNDHAEIDYIEVRFYGGWYRERELTRVGSQVITEHLSMSLFPVVVNGRRIRGEQKIVDTLNDIDYIWYNTYREKHGLPRLVFSPEAKGALCDRNKLLCPINILKRFSKSSTRLCSIEGCSTSNGAAITQMGQKMVDAMMVCDIISFSMDKDLCSLVVLTDDVDLFPAFAVGRNNNPELDIQLGIINTQNILPYTECLKPFTINVFQLYDRLRA